MHLGQEWMEETWLYRLQFAYLAMAIVRFVSAFCRALRDKSANLKSGANGVEIDKVWYKEAVAEYEADEEIGLQQASQ
ncbi:hypothetical protein RRG08_054341 [Elysia crispata]|uniref:Uncharacterized protein n=1 Tax=Elysia crispata TaxID=231223 RepID=A0AAE1E9D2_9GAST|nr:hypothetical protein RRG08_054341 [Elysia crispata]